MADRTSGHKGGPLPTSKSDGIVRPGPGNPRLTQINVRLVDDEYAALKEFAQDSGLSISRAVARLVRDVLLDE